jgi:hypothetical protein
MPIESLPAMAAQFVTRDAVTISVAFAKCRNAWSPRSELTRLDLRSWQLNFV